MGSKAKPRLNAWGGKLKEGWRDAEQKLRYRDKGLVTLPLVRSLLGFQEELPKTYRMVEVKWEEGK